LAGVRGESRNTLAVAAVLVPALAVPAHATGSPGCITRAEYKKIHKGMTKAKVKQIAGTNGKREAHASAGGYRTEVRSYKTCSRSSAVAVSFSANPHKPLKVDAKSAVWA